jgi:hypothetical protein
LGYDRQLNNNRRLFSILSKTQSDSLTLMSFIALNNNLFRLNAVDDMEKSANLYLKKSLIINSKFHIANSYRWIGIHSELLRK